MIKLTKDLIVRSSTEEFITFKLQEKDKGIQVRYENETLWMTQKAMSELFNVEQPAIAKHLINIYNGRPYKVRLQIHLYKQPVQESA